MGAEEMAQQKRAHTALAETLSTTPKPMSGISHSPLTPSQRDPLSFSGFRGYCMWYTNPRAEAHIELKVK